MVSNGRDKNWEPARSAGLEVKNRAGVETCSLWCNLILLNCHFLNTVLLCLAFIMVHFNKVNVRNSNKYVLN